VIGVLVEFQFGDDFDAAKVAAIAQGARAQFEGMPGLRQKAFTIDEANRRARNVYLWDDEDAARAFFNDALVERVTGIYGVAPTITFVEVAELVDNASR